MIMIGIINVIIDEFMILFCEKIHFADDPPWDVIVGTVEINRELNGRWWRRPVWHGSIIHGGAVVGIVVVDVEEEDGLVECVGGKELRTVKYWDLNQWRVHWVWP